MASVSRTALFGKIHKILKKYHKPVSPPAERTVLEHLLFACVLEDARYELAEEAFAALRHTFYDWNEVRVTSISELSEIMSAIPNPRSAANRIKRVLHSIFEELYCFDLEEKRKNNLGPTVKWLEKMDGTTKFVVAYVVQSALGGHSIPVDAGTLAAFRVLDLLTDKELAVGEVPGMERAVSKSKGVEFGSLVHQLGADYLANPFSPQVREILLAIDPEASKRFPQPREPRPEPPHAAEVASPHPVTTGRKKKTEAAVIGPVVPEGNTAESNTDEMKPAEAKKVVGSASTKAAESASESSASEKQHVKPRKAEKAEKAEKHSQAEKAEKHEKRSAEASNTPSVSDGLGKRKPR